MHLSSKLLVFQTYCSNIDSLARSQPKTTDAALNIDLINQKKMAANDIEDLLGRKLLLNKWVD